MTDLISNTAATEISSSGPLRSLILAGGGMRVAYQAGVLKALSEAGIAFQHADGTSGGTINLAMLLSGLPPDEMCARWRTLDVKRFSAFMPIEDYLRAWDMMGMASANGIREHVFPHLGIDLHAINAAQSISGTFNVCNYSRKVAEVVPHQKLTLDLLVAGISLPIFMPPVKINGDWYTDAVWIKDANLMEAVRRGSDELWVVWCIGNIKEYNPGAFYQYVHMIEMAANGRLFEEFEQIKDVNRKISNGEKPFDLTRTIKLHVIKPVYPLPLDPDFFTGKVTASTLLEMGYADACRYLETEMTPVGLPFEPEATQMKTEGVGITFSKSMQGGFTFETGDVDAGYRRGQAAGTLFTLHITVRIHDVAEFVANTSHDAEVSGNVSYPGLGELIPLKNSVFSHASSDNSGMTTINYSLRFRSNASEYRLECKAAVQDTEAEDPRVGITALRCKLFRGAGEAAEVAGAGILKFDGEGMTEMVRTMHATNAHSIEEKTRALYDFGRFYFRGIWTKYASRLHLD
jgi:predicted acylesterase/phospholipase RssA